MINFEYIDEWNPDFIFNLNFLYYIPIFICTCIFFYLGMYLHILMSVILKGDFFEGRFFLRGG